MVNPPPGIDDGEFFSRMTNEDALGTVILGVIYIDYELVTLLEELVVDVHSLNQMHLDFSKRVHLAVALGLDNRFSAPLRALGTLRNKFAHRPDATVGAQDSKNLYKSLSQIEKKIVQDGFRKSREKVAKTSFADEFNKLEPLDLIRLIIVGLRQALRAARIHVERSTFADGTREG